MTTEKWFVEKTRDDDIIIHPGATHPPFMLKLFDSFYFKKGRVFFEKFPRSADKDHLPVVRVSYDFGTPEMAHANFWMLKSAVATQSKWPNERYSYDEVVIEPDKMIMRREFDKFVLEDSCICFWKHTQNAFPVMCILYDYGTLEYAYAKYSTLQKRIIV